MKNSTQHKFIQKEAGGATFETSWSFQKCERCGVCFTHKYHIETFEEAIKRTGIKKECCALQRKRGEDIIKKLK